MKSKDELRKSFENGDIPKQEEFWDWQDSYWHKDEKLPADKIDYDFSKKADLVNGKVPASQLPSYVDDVLEFDTFKNLPSPGEKGKIYVVTDNNNQYRWSGTEYIQTNLGNLAGKLIPYTGATQNVNLNSKNLSNVGLLEATALKNNSSSVNIKSLVVQNNTTVSSFGIKLNNSSTSNMMGSFTVTLFGYIGQTLSFRVSMYKYNYTWHYPTITWLHGDSSKISNIEFYKEDDSNIHIKVNFATNFGSYHKSVITDVLAHENDVLHNPDTYTLSINPDNSAHTLVQTTSNTGFVRDNIGDVPKASISLGTSDLNTITIPGFYHQITNSNATLVKNYPITARGSLNVYKSGDVDVVQQYTTYLTRITYKRSYTGSAWTSWTQLIDSVNGGTISADLSVSKTDGGNINIGTGGANGSNAAPKYTNLNFLGYSNAVKAKISSSDIGANNVLSPLIFYTYATTGLQESMRIQGGGNIDFVGNLNRTTGELILQRQGVDTIRTGGTSGDSLTLSAQGSTGTIYFRPQGVNTTTGQVYINSTGTINTSSHGNSSQWNAAYQTSLNAVTTNTVQDVIETKNFTKLQKFRGGIKYFDGNTNSPYLNKYENKSVYAPTTSSSTGNVKITFPSFGSATMWSMKVKVLQYSATSTNTKTVQLPMTITVTGYNVSAGSANVNWGASGNNFHTNFVGVRTGIDASNNKIVWLDFNSALTYPKVIIEEILVHHSGATSSLHDNNWAIDITTDETGYTNQTTILLSDFKELVTEGKIAIWDAAGAEVGNNLKTLGNGVAKYNQFTSDTFSIRNSSAWAQGTLNRPLNQNSAVVNFTPYNSGGATYGFSLGARNNKLFFVTEEASTFGSWNEIYHTGNFSPSNYLPLAGGTMSGTLTLNGFNAAYILKDVSTLTGGFERKIFGLTATNGLQDALGYFGTNDTSGNLILSYGYLGGTAYNTKNAIRWTPDGRVGIGLTSSSKPTTGYALDVSGNILATSFVKSGGTSSQFLKADGSVDSNNYSLSNHTHTFASLTSKPTTLAGYGITDAFNQNSIKSQNINSGQSSQITTLDAFLPNGGYITSYGVPTWGGTDAPTGASYGGFIKFGDSSGVGNNGLQFYYNNGHGTSTGHKLWFRTKNSTVGTTNWFEVATREWVNSQLPTSYTLPAATTTALGGVRLFSATVNTSTPNTPTATAGKTYAIQFNSSNQMVVNVPWTDNNTTYTASTGLILTGTSFSVNYGTTAGTAAQGNDSRINNGQTAFSWGNHANAGYASTAFVEQSIDGISTEITDPDFSVSVKNKFVTVIITQNFSKEKINWEAFYPGQSVTVINTGSNIINLELQGKAFDKISARETFEYYVNKDKRLIKKGSYKETAIII